MPAIDVRRPDPDRLEAIAAKLEREAAPLMAAEVRAAIEEIRELRFDRRALFMERHEIDQVLGKALGYPPAYPDASPVDDGTVVTGPHTVVTLADEVASRLSELRAEVERLKAGSCDDGCRIQRAVREFCASSELKSSRVHQVAKGDGS